VLYDTNDDVSPIVFDTKKINEYKKNKDFDYSEEELEENWWQKFKRWLGRIWSDFWYWLLGDFKGNSFLVFLIKILPYLIVGGIIAFIIWLFYKLNPGATLFKSKKNPEIFFTDEEEIIKSQNIQELIEKALLEKDYRLAVRYHYLFTLKKLSDANIIHYEFDKTNSDYTKEIKDEHILIHFVKVTIIYEYIWYGSFEVSEPEYERAQKMFFKMTNIIPENID
ncbi:MAG: DUF4129 domain-containing protein, partial [Flavobacteriales bacterium]|nr:DUF4129 domain-containing protein [Flavobacteriales bacterium]